MEFDVSRLRRGELVAGGGALVLLLNLLLVPWYGIKSPFDATAVTTFHISSTTDGWDGLQHLRWLALVTIVLAFALVWFQGSSRAPAVPAAISAVLIVIGLINVLALLYRVVINVPGSAVVGQRAGAFIGLGAAIVLWYGSYLSLRQEGLPKRDAPTDVETVRLGPPATGPSTPAS
jgi:predicted signal transduction protein with EAL and GGDEF domain